MAPERWERLQALFHRALELPEPARAGFLDQCAEEPSLIADVRAMLGEDAQPVHLLNRGLAELANAILHSPVDQQKFHPYKLVKLLGEGGMGVVYLAQHQDTQQAAAVKVLRDAWISHTRRERFILEQRTLAELTHPHIARLYEAHAPADDTPWFAMEYVDGLSMTKHCREYRLDIPARLKLFRSLCSAVQHAHDHHLVHRDLKPSNVLVSASGVVKLLDFGIAKHVDASQDSSAPSPGSRWMTRSYAAPEQLRGEATGVRTDIYSLGVFLYELLADRLPHDASRRSAALAEPPPPSSDAELNRLCAVAMAPRPEERFPTVAALNVDLDAYLSRAPFSRAASTTA